MHVHYVDSFDVVLDDICVKNSYYISSTCAPSMVNSCSFVERLLMWLTMKTFEYFRSQKIHQLDVEEEERTSLNASHFHDVMNFPDECTDCWE